MGWVFFFTGIAEFGVMLTNSFSWRVVEVEWGTPQTLMNIALEPASALTPGVVSPGGMAKGGQSKPLLDSVHLASRTI